MKNQWHLSLWLSAALVFTGLTLAQETSNEIVWDATNPGAGVPEQLGAGFTKVTVINGGDGYVLVLYRLKEGTSLEQVEGLDKAITEAWETGGETVVTAMNDLFEVAEFMGENIFSSDVGILLEEGSHVLSGSFLATVTELTYYPFEVVASDTSATTPEADITVQMEELTYAMPSEIKAGEQTWQVTNAGQELHNMTLYKLAEGKTLEELSAFLQSGNAEGDPPGEGVGFSGGVGPGRSTFVTFDLEPGTYVALDTMLDYGEDGSGQPNFTLGMIQSFTVTE